MFYKVLFLLACMELIKRVRSFIKENVVVNDGKTELETGAVISVGLSVLFYMMVLCICFAPSMLFGGKIIGHFAYEPAIGKRLVIYVDKDVLWTSTVADVRNRTDTGIEVETRNTVYVVTFDGEPIRYAG